MKNIPSTQRRIFLTPNRGITCNTGICPTSAGLEKGMDLASRFAHEAGLNWVAKEVQILTREKTMIHSELDIEVA